MKLMNRRVPHIIQWYKTDNKNTVFTEGVCKEVLFEWGSFLSYLSNYLQIWYWLIWFFFWAICTFAVEMEIKLITYNHHQWWFMCCIWYSFWGIEFLAWVFPFSLLFTAQEAEFVLFFLFHCIYYVTLVAGRFVIPDYWYKLRNNWDAACVTVAQLQSRFIWIETIWTRDWHHHTQTRLKVQQDKVVKYLKLFKL